MDSQVILTPKMQEIVNDIDVDGLLTRHFQGDYGDIPMEAQLSNDLVMYNKKGIFKSCYGLPDGTTVIIQTIFNATLTCVGVEGEI